MKRTKRSCLATLVVAALLLVSLCVPAMAAQTELELSTTYPGMTAKAGDSLSYTITLANHGASGTIANLAIAELPEGWSGYYSGSSSGISQVYVKAGGEATVNFQLIIPEDAQDGIYTVVLGAEDAVLTLTLDVTAQEVGSSALATQYAEQEGASGTAFTFSTTIQNNTPNEQNYSFTAKAPDGWSVTFFPSGESTQVAAITVPARSSQAMDVVVTPSADVEADTFTIPISAISATETLETELSVTIKGTYLVTLSTPSGRLSFDAVANQQSAVTLQVSNQGNVDLQNVNLTSSAPTGWTVEFSESTIEILEAGATREVTAYVTPSEDAMSGDYAMTISVKNTSASDSEDFRVTVKTETIWGVVGVGLLVLVMAGLWVVFQKFGRR